MALGEGFDQVLLAARTGADWAWASLYRETAPVVARYLRARGAADVDDLVGDTFVQVVRRLSTFEGDEAGFRAWVCAIARNRAIDVRRQVARRPVEPAAPDVLLARGPTGDVEDDALRSLGDAHVRRVLDRLTDDQRDVLLLRILAGLTVTEVAQVMGRGDGAVKMLQARALSAIRREISAGAVTL